MSLTRSLPPAYNKARRKGKQSNATFPGVPNGMPRTRSATLRYVERIFINSNSGIMATTKFRANGLFDPRVSTGGAQPLGFDQWAILYNHYVVKSASISIRTSNSDIANPVVVGCYLGDDTALPYVAYTELMEARKGTAQIVTPFNTGTSDVLSKYSAKGFFNVTNIKDNVDRLGAPVTADPVEQAIWTVYVQSLDVTTDTGAQLIITVDYDVEFSEPKDLPVS